VYNTLRASQSKGRDPRYVRLAYQPPAISTFFSKQTNHQQPASATFLSQRISTSHQPSAKRTGCLLPSSADRVV
jgi:hypothetical protein